MISKDEMLALVRSVAVHDDVEQGMGHAFDLGTDWERARVVKILKANKIDASVLDAVLCGVEYK